MLGWGWWKTPPRCETGVTEARHSRVVGDIPCGETYPAWSAARVPAFRSDCSVRPLGQGMGGSYQSISQKIKMLTMKGGKDARLPFGTFKFEIAKDGYYIGYVCSKSTSVQRTEEPEPILWY